MTKHRQDLSFYLRYPFLFIVFICTLPYGILSQCPGTSCTYTISGSDSGTYTVNIGEKICFDAGADFTGTIDLNDGELINCATAPQTISFSVSPSGVINNYGIFDFPVNHSFTNGLTVNNYSTLNFSQDLTVMSGSVFNNFGVTNIDGQILNISQVNNSGTLTIIGPISENTSAVLSNSGSITASSWTVNGTWDNSGIIDLVGNFTHGNGKIGTINGGCLSSNDWTNRGTITGNTCGDINIAGTSTLASSGSLLGNIAIIDATPPGSAPFIDIANGTIDPTIVWASCNSCPSEEICNNGLDDDGDGYTDGDDPDCITAGSCGCPPGGTIITELPFGYTVPIGSSHCLNADETLNTSWNNVSVHGDLYILSGNTLTINNGFIFYGNYGNLIVCEDAGYVDEIMSTNPSKIYNNGWLQMCGTTMDVDSIILGTNSVTALKGDELVINDTIIYVGDTNYSPYVFVDMGVSINGVNSGNACLPGSTDIILQSNNPSITPTCVTDCNGCPELSTISGVCNDGSVEAAYLALNSTLEICGNTIDDNNDGRVDEPFPGGVQGNMQLWLKADQGSSTSVNGDPIYFWNDQSIHANNANPDPNITSFPSFTQNAINFNPGINFSGDYIDDYSDGLHLGSNYIYSENAAIQIFAVVRPNVDGEDDNYVLDFGSSPNQGYGIRYSDTSYGIHSNGTNTQNAHTNGDLPALLEGKIDFANEQVFFCNGLTKGSAPITLTELNAANISENSTYGLSASNGPVSIGRKSASVGLASSGGQIFNGDIAEIIVYNEELTNVERRQVNSYLGLKYGLTIAQNYYSSSNTTIKGIADGYGNDIFGIGRDDCSGLNQKQSKSVEEDGVVTLSLGAIAANNQSNPNTFSGDESFLIVGNDDQTVDTWSPVGGSSSDSRINRTWKIDNTNITQNITFTIDMDDPENDIAALTAGALSDYKIMFDLDGDFTNGGSLTTSLTNTTGSLYEITLNPGSWQYFTIVHQEQVVVDEICNNSIDDNGDGRIDEVFPGGVQQDMQLWLKAEVGTNTDVDGNDVTAWADQSINGYSADADVNSTDDPTFSENAINFNPGVDFDGTFTDGYSDGLHLGSDYIYGEKDGMHIFVICDPDVAASTDKYVFDFGLQSNGGYGMIYSDNDYGMYTNSTSGGINTELFHSEGDEPALVEMKVDFDDAQEFYRNGDLLSSIAVTIPDLDETKVNEAPVYGPLGTTSGPVSIGRKSTSAFLDQNGGRMFDGRISEVIVFTDTLSSLEKQQVNSYLAVKYGLTISQNYLSSAGSIKKDVSDGYANDIAGIGKDDCAGLHQKQSKSVEPDAIVTVGKGTIASTNDANGNSIVSDDSYLIWGNDGAAVNASWNSANVTIPGVDLSSIDRTWKLTETLDITNTLFQIEVDNPNFDLPAMPGTADGTYYLLRDDDGDFTNGGTTYEPMSLSSGDKWQTTIADPTSEFFTIAVGTVCGAQAPVLSK